MRHYLSLLVVLLLAALGCTPDATAGDAGAGGARELPTYRGDRPVSDAGASDHDGGPADAGVHDDDGGVSGGCVPEISGARFGVCAGRMTTIERDAEGARFGVTGTFERAPATTGAGRFGVTGGEIHVP